MISPSLEAGWKMMKFGDVVKNANLSERDPEAAGIERIVGLEHLDPENLHIRRWNTLENDTSFTRKFVPGQTLFGKRRAYQRKVAFAEFEGICSGDILTFEPKDPNVLLPELLPFICQTDAFFDHALGTSAGSLSPRTSYKTLQNFEFPLPPFEEQKRIAEILWASDEAVEKYLRARERLTFLKSQVLREQLANNSAKTVPCAELFERPPRNGYSPKTNASGEGSRTLSIGAVRDGSVNPEGNTKYADISAADLEKFELSTGDVLIVRGNGNKNLCGKAGLVSSIPSGYFYPDLLIRLSFDENKILPEFAVEQWNEPKTHSRLLSVAKSTNGIWKINGKDLKQHTLDILPIEVQQGIVTRLNNLKSLDTETSAHIDRLRNLRTTLSNCIFEASKDV